MLVKWQYEGQEQSREIRWDKTAMLNGEPALTLAGIYRNGWAIPAGMFRASAEERRLVRTIFSQKLGLPNDLKKLIDDDDVGCWMVPLPEEILEVLGNVGALTISVEFMGENWNIQLEDS